MMDSKDRWEHLLSGTRLRPSSGPKRGDEGNEFLSDYQRVVFSSAFRRLQDKTQVTPLAASDYLRKRLTHSVEVSVVGERMGRVLAHRLKGRLPDGDQRDRFGKVVATACLLHDVGNPPFGHEGELAIRGWADSRSLSYADYRGFDGNAQGFRIAVRLQHQGGGYGMNLTVATLATMLKYPRVPTAEGTSAAQPRARGKWSVLSSEERHYERVRETVGLRMGARHPLSYVVEAADDIVNRLVDIEDALKVGLVSFGDVCDALEGVDHESVHELRGQMTKRLAQMRRDRTGRDESDREMLAYQRFRVDAAAALAESCEDLFEEKIELLEQSEFGGALVEECELAGLYGAIQALENEKIFGDPSIVRVEAGGKAAIRQLLDLLYDEVKAGSKLGRTVPHYLTLDGEDEPEELIHVRRVVDYVSGMTDRFAVTLFKELSGMSL